MSDDLDDRRLKAVDVASTFIQVLIGLASGILTGVLAFLKDIMEIQNLDLSLLKISLILFGVSVGAGLVGLAGLVGRVGNSSVANPHAEQIVTIPVFIQLVFFGLAVIMMIILIPTSR